MSASLRQTIGNTMPALPPLMAAVNRFLAKHALPQAAIFRVNLAIEEIVTNIIKYGYDDKNVHAIKVFLDISPATIHLRMEDDGHLFNPLKAPEPDIHAPLARRKIGGLGLRLVREIAGHMAYRREKKVNILEMDIARVNSGSSQNTTTG